MAKEQVQGRSTFSKVMDSEPAIAIYEIAHAMRFLAGKLDDDNQHGAACISSILSEQLQEIGEKLDNEEWQPSKEANHA